MLFFAVPLVAEFNVFLTVAGFGDATFLEAPRPRRRAETTSPKEHFHGIQMFTRDAISLLLVPLEKVIHTGGTLGT
ncbi:uncharacterized protein LOC105717181 [Aotus nancymaae]|uniref:uncharacterized protein LOC105717181 n=1 Tax=Aotus nancymaae TaxID=37293 RepID=UPI0030FEBDAE